VSRDLPQRLRVHLDSTAVQRTQCALLVNRVAADDNASPYIRPMKDLELTSSSGYAAPSHGTPSLRFDSGGRMSSPANDRGRRDVHSIELGPADSRHSPMLACGRECQF